MDRQNPDPLFIIVHGVYNTPRDQLQSPYFNGFRHIDFRHVQWCAGRGAWIGGEVIDGALDLLPEIAGKPWRAW